ncbi:MAG: tyrosine-type recombinase/integrase [Acidobacteriota bacterium]
MSAINKLTQNDVRRHIAKGPGGKLSDGGGLYLQVSKAGTPLWRVKYSYGSKPKLYAVPQGGGLTEAREARALVKSLLVEGRDPVQVRAATKQQGEVEGQSTFTLVMESWLEKQKAEWSAIHYRKSREALERDILPYLGKHPVSMIHPEMITECVKRVAARGAQDTASKILWHVVSIFRLAEARRLIPQGSNPAAPVREELPKRRSKGRRPAFLDIAELGDLLRRTDAAHVTPAVRLALRLLAFTAQRPGNIIAAKWDQFDLSDDAVWTIPRSTMKVRDREHDHRVPLGPTIAAELRAWKRSTSGTGYVFPSTVGTRDHIGLDALSKVYRSLGVQDKHSPHGWRSSFSSLARDAGFARDVVEMALDHIHDKEVVRAYDRGERKDERVKLAYWWDSQLIAAQHGTEPLSMVRGVA